jgi:aromatic ring-opening dioxygenase LigB subunit
MSKLVGCALMPHPPIMIPEVGKEDLKKIQATVNAAESVAHMLKENNPQTIVIITPHGPVFKDAISISIHPRLKGNLEDFDAPDVALGFETDGLLVRHILKQAERLGINLMQLTEDLAKNYRFTLQLDHGAIIPLYYLHKAGFKGQLVHISIGMLPYEEMYTFGKALQAAINALDKKVAVIASGDLSHRLTPDAPAGYDPAGIEFDKQIIEVLKEVNIKAVLNLDRQLVAAAGECGLRPICVLMGVLGGLDVSSEVLSYEGPFGVGYAVATFRINN